MADRSPKTIATINFKGGVGKTTVTWCLADVLSTMSNNKVLMFDLDAQMSLTQAITLNEDTGTLNPKFERWYNTAIARKKTIFDAIDAFTRPNNRFDFGVGFDVIYQISDELHFIPSVEDLYWLELEVFDRDSMKEFIRRLLGRITNNQQLPSYDYVLFDCPPSFTLLSYSVLSCCDLILIPVNPDFFAAKGVDLLLNSLRMRIEPHPLPKIGVFMNKAKTYRNVPTQEAMAYARDVERVCRDASSRTGVQAKYFSAYVRDRVGIRRAITGGGVPTDMVPDFQSLWRETVEYLEQ